jgi:hypothetical protein
VSLEGLTLNLEAMFSKNVLFKAGLLETSNDCVFVFTTASFLARTFNVAANAGQI